MTQADRDFMAMASSPNLEWLLGRPLASQDHALSHSRTHGLSGYTVREIEAASTITHLSPAICPCQGCRTRRGWHSASH